MPSGRRDDSENSQVSSSPKSPHQGQRQGISIEEDEPLPPPRPDLKKVKNQKTGLESTSPGARRMNKKDVAITPRNENMDDVGASDLMTVDQVRKSNPIEKIEAAKKLAHSFALFKPGHVLRTNSEMYKLTSLITENAFGFVYEAEAVDSGECVLVKTEPVTEDPALRRFKTLKNELCLLQMIEVSQLKFNHFPKFFDCGLCKDFKFVVTSLVGESLYQVKKFLAGKCFTPSTALRVSVQTLQGLRDLHSLGYLHRFIKPQSFCIGAGSSVKVVFLTDFTLSCCFRNKKGDVKQTKKKMPIIGALRYTSRHSHLGQELSMRDDLESWLYLTLEFYHANVLPWKGDQIAASVLYKKQKFFEGEFPRVFQKAPVEYSAVMYHIGLMKCGQEIDYDYILEQIFKARKANKMDLTVPYDWEDDGKSVKTPVTTFDPVEHTLVEHESEKELKAKSVKKRSKSESTTSVEVKDSPKVFNVEKFHAPRGRKVNDAINVSIATTTEDVKSAETTTTNTKTSKEEQKDEDEQDNEDA